VAKALLLAFCRVVNLIMAKDWQECRLGFLHIRLFFTIFFRFFNTIMKFVRGVRHRFLSITSTSVSMAKYDIFLS
jgi:hypothetical protein